MGNSNSSEPAARQLQPHVIGFCYRFLLRRGTEKTEICKRTCGLNFLARHFVTGWCLCVQLKTIWSRTWLRISMATTFTTPPLKMWSPSRNSRYGIPHGLRLIFLLIKSNLKGCCLISAFPRANNGSVYSFRAFFSHQAQESNITEVRE